MTNTSTIQGKMLFENKIKKKNIYSWLKKKKNLSSLDNLVTTVLRFSNVKQPIYLPVINYHSQILTANCLKGKS